MSNAELQASAARQLLASSLHGVLSTHSQEHPGYPFGSVAPYILGHDGLPLFLLSHLSQHTHNVDGDPRCGLLVSEPGDGDVQQLGRLSAVGELGPTEPGIDGDRYFRYYPRTRTYHEQLGFRFYRFRPLHFHWNGGFATARWFGNDRILRANPFASGDEAALITRLTDDALPGLMVRPEIAAMRAGADAIAIAGIDPEGIDLRCGDAHVRIPLRAVADSVEALRKMLVDGW